MPLDGFTPWPEDTALAFTPDGFHRTGHLARPAPEGDLVVEGRVGQRPVGG